MVTKGSIFQVFENRPFNPLSPKSDQHQISPHNINTKSKDQVMRMNKMITKGKLV